MNTNIMQALHDSEINGQISSFFDGCWIVRLGDEANGFTAESTQASNYAEAEEELARLACERYPQSEFAKRYRKPAPAEKE